MPQFCRHNRLVHNCPICSREQSVELRPLVSSSAPRVAEPRERTPGSPTRREPSGRAASPRGVTVRRLRNTVDDGYRSSLLLGVKSSQEAARLADELAFSATRLRSLQNDPPGLYAEVAHGAGDIEERTWLAFLIAYLAPVETEAPFSNIAPALTTWGSGEPPHLDDAATGPRTAHEPARGTRTIEAYRAWAGRAGSQAAAFSGDVGWTPERRFSRVFERLALPGLHRDARFELLVSLGTLGLYDLFPDSLQLGGSDQVTAGAKRALGIGDPLLLGRRASELAAAGGVPLAALDLAFYNWESTERATGGLGPGAEADPALREQIGSAIGV